jgi:succinyl-CoA synthetase alpha subunit
MKNLVVKVLKNRYIDSVSLMALSTKANQIEHVSQAIVAMATDMNKEVMRNADLTNEVVEQAQASDLVITMKITDEGETQVVLAKVEELLTKKEKVTTTNAKRAYHTIQEAVKNEKANLALISVNGHYATREALQALNNNLNVMMFSDNVSVADEKMLKEVANENGLLMMGPDCGTAIINNIGLGFANNVRRGNIGIIGASGTGSQEISVRIHEFGGGISQLLGTGGRDLTAEIGGKMMLAGIDLLAQDPDTEVIVLISKPPAIEVQEKIIAKVKTIQKPVVIWFVGEMTQRVDGNIYFEAMSKNAALKAVELAGVDTFNLDVLPLNVSLIEEVKQKLTSKQKYIRGLFTGGTLAAEAYYITKQKYANVYSNIAKNPENQVNENSSDGHIYIDFGADEYTDGKPHPMIDPSNRINQFRKEAQNPKVGVILLDFVLGYGAHQDPVGVMVEEIIQAKQQAEKDGRHLEVIGYVLGTDRDTQNLDEQLAKLEHTGATYASSMQNAALLAREFVGKDE